MADRFPLIVDDSGTPVIKELPTGDVLDLTGTTIKAVSIDTTLSVTGNTTLTGTLSLGGSDVQTQLDEKATTGKAIAMALVFG
jgi:hypothetical protein